MNKCCAERKAEVETGAGLALRLDHGESLSARQLSSTVLFGNVPAGEPMRHRQPFSPELEQALDRAREANGRYMVVVYTEESVPVAGGGTKSTLNRFSTKGDAWSDDWMVRAYRLFCELLTQFPQQQLPAQQDSSLPKAG